MRGPLVRVCRGTRATACDPVREPFGRRASLGAADADIHLARGDPRTGRTASGHPRPPTPRSFARASPRQRGPRRIALPPWRGRASGSAAERAVRHEERWSVAQRAAPECCERARAPRPRQGDRGRRPHHRSGGSLDPRDRRAQDRSDPLVRASAALVLIARVIASRVVAVWVRLGRHLAARCRRVPRLDDAVLARPAWAAEDRPAHDGKCDQRGEQPRGQTSFAVSAFVHRIEPSVPS